MKLTTLPTLISLSRLANIIRYSELTSTLEGDVAEFGVFQGGVLELLAKLNRGKNVIGIDSFEGLPEATPKDNYHKKGDFSEVDYPAILGYFKTMYRNVELYKGYSPEIFKEITEYRKYSFVHIDVDLYQSVKDGLDFFYPRMVDGGVIICDDIGWESVKGGESALMEFAETIHPQFKGELFFHPGQSQNQYLIIK